MYTFENKPDIQKKALQKALQSPRIGKHGKRKATLAKESVLQQIQERNMRNIDLLSKAQLHLAFHGKNGGPDLKAIISILDRTFGKPTQAVSAKRTEDLCLAKLLDRRNY